MAKPVQDYRLKHPTYGMNLTMGQIVVEYADGSPIYALTSEHNMVQKKVRHDMGQFHK